MLKNMGFTLTVGLDKQSNIKTEGSQDITDRLKF